MGNFGCARSFGRITLIGMTATLVACGGGGDGPSSTQTYSPSAVTATQIESYSDQQIIDLGVGIKELSDAALGALSEAARSIINSPNPKGQIQSLSPLQIDVLSPSQVRQIGSLGGTVPAKIAFLNPQTWSTLVGNVNQVAAILPGEFANLNGDKISLIGGNVRFLTDDVLRSLSYYTLPSRPLGQIQSLTADQMRALSPEQVRLIGDAWEKPGAKLKWLSIDAWAALASDPEQVKRLMSVELVDMNGDKISAMGVNLRYLSDGALRSLSYYTLPSRPIGHIQALTPIQILSLTPAQVRLIGVSIDPRVAKLNRLDFETWLALVSMPEQVAAITADEMQYLSGERIAAMRAAIADLSDSALCSLRAGAPLDAPAGAGQLQSITAAQIRALSPRQYSIIAGVNDGRGGSLLSESAASAVSDDQRAAAQGIWPCLGIL